MATIGRHRRCGCDCRDSDRYTPDPLVFNPLFDCGCSGAVKPPCKYIARFECSSFDASDQTRYIFEPIIPLRQICEYGATLGQYSAIMYAGSGGSSIPFQSFQAAELASSVPYACSWMDRLNPQQNLAAAAQIYAAARWTLNTVGTVTFTHRNGIQYALPDGVTWDCFGPNTLVLVSGSTGAQDGLQQWVCITPEIERFQSQDGCCDNCYETSIPAIQAGDSYFMPQRLEFMQIAPNQPDYSPSYACQYKAFVKLYVTTTSGFSGTKSTCFYGQQDLTSQFGSQFTTVRLLVQAQTESGQPSPAVLKISYMRSCAATSPIEAIYHCPSFGCTGGTFTLTTNDPAMPATITVTARSCYYEEVNDWGMVPQCQGGGIIHDPNRPTYDDEYSRYHCCDPWGACAPGSIQVLCSGKGIQRLTGCFCTGGHTGTTSPKGPSRELCGSFVAADGTSHTVCCVVYCNSGSAWTSDWYCDGSYVGPGTGGSVTCCPHTFKHNMPAMSCLPGCTGCVAINTEPDCQPPADPCSCASINNTVTVTMAGPFLNDVFTLTKSGSSWTGNDHGGSTWGLSCSGGVWTLASLGLLIVMTPEVSFVCSPFELHFLYSNPFSPNDGTTAVITN